MILKKGIYKYENVSKKCILLCEFLVVPKEIHTYFRHFYSKGQNRLLASSYGLNKYMQREKRKENWGEEKELKIVIHREYTKKEGKDM